MKTATFAKQFATALTTAWAGEPIPDKLMAELAQHLRPSEIHVLLDNLCGIDDPIDSRVGPRDGQTSYINMRD